MIVIFIIFFISLCFFAFEPDWLAHIQRTNEWRKNKLGKREIINMKKFKKLFLALEWVHKNGNYYTYQPKENIKSYPVYSGTIISSHVFLFDKTFYTTWNSISYYKIRKFLNSNPPLTNTERTVIRRDVEIQKMLEE